MLLDYFRQLELGSTAALAGFVFSLILDYTHVLVVVFALLLSFEPVLCVHLQLQLQILGRWVPDWCAVAATLLLNLVDRSRQLSRAYLAIARKEH